MENKQIRRKILEYLYQVAQESPCEQVSRQEIIEKLGISGTEADRSVVYLDEKGYLRKHGAMGTVFVSAIITARGIDLVEDPQEFNTLFPIQVTQNIVTNSVGVAIGNGNSQSISIQSSFNDIYQRIEESDLKDKPAVKKAVNSIEQELGKESPNKTVIAKSIDFLKKNASWVVPIVAELVKTVMGV